MFFFVTRIAFVFYSNASQQQHNIMTRMAKMMMLMMTMMMTMMATMTLMMTLLTMAIDTKACLVRNNSSKCKKSGKISNGLYVPEQPAPIGFGCQYIVASFSLVLFVFSTAMFLDKNLLLFGQICFANTFLLSIYCFVFFA